MSRPLTADWVSELIPSFTGTTEEIRTLKVQILSTRREGQYKRKVTLGPPFQLATARNAKKLRPRRSESRFADSVEAMKTRPRKTERTGPACAVKKEEKSGDPPDPLPSVAAKGRSMAASPPATGRSKNIKAEPEKAARRRVKTPPSTASTPKRNRAPSLPTAQGPKKGKEKGLEKEKKSVAKGKFARSMVFRGLRQRTTGGLRKDNLERNSRGKVVHKGTMEKRKKTFRGSKFEAWLDAVSKARKHLGLTGFVAIGGTSVRGKALHAQAKAFFDLARSKT